MDNIKVILLVVFIVAILLIQAIRYLGQMSKIGKNQPELLDQLKPSRILATWEGASFRKFYGKKIPSHIEVYRLEGKIEFAEIKISSTPDRVYFINGVSINKRSTNILNKIGNGALIKKLNLNENHVMEFVFLSGNKAKWQAYPVSINDWNLSN